MMRSLLLAASMLATLLASETALARNVALVIGNGAYKNTSALPNPANDAKAFSAFLTSAGYDVTFAADTTRAELSAALSNFSSKLEADDTAVFYYAGHGVQMGGENYLVGVEAKLASEFDVPAETIQLSSIIALMETKAKVSMIFIDACRDNPLAGNLAKTATRSVSRGLAPVEATGDGTMIAFAAGPGQLAFDGNGQNSPFTTALIKHLGSPGIEVSTAFKRVIAEVRVATENRQSPQIVSSLSAEIFFGGTVSDGAVASVVDAAEIDYAKAERLNTTRGWQLFVEKHPEGFFTELARKALDLLLDDKNEGLTPQQAEDLLELNKAVRAEIQLALNDLGYKLGAPDGVFGGNTRREIARYQLAAGLQETGFVTAPMLTKLGIPLLSEGAKVVSADEARNFDVADLEGLETDTRLLGALACLKGKQVQYGFFEGHAYIAVLTWGKTWTDSRAEAVKCGGDLVSIGSEAENDFVFSLFASDDRFFQEHAFSPTEVSIGGPLIGMNQDPAGREPSGGWGWSDGSPVTFTAWDDQSNSEDREDIAAYWANYHFEDAPSDRSKTKRTWGDIVDYGSSYVMELS